MRRGGGFSEADVGALTRRTAVFSLLPSEQVLPVEHMLRINARYYVVVLATPAPPRKKTH